MRMELKVSSPTGDPAHPVTITTRITNPGRKPAYYLGSCNGPLTRLIDPEARHVNDRCGEGCPNEVCVACAPSPVEIPPGESVEQVLVFTGELMDCDTTYAGPGGEYRAEALTKVYRADGSEITMSKSVKFTWTAAP
jgi:hypothetical protein